MKKVVILCGKAGQFLLENPYKELMLRRVREDKEKTKKLQLYYALAQDDFQCERCSHFYSSKKKLAQHRQHKECLDINFQPKKKYAQDDNDQFFCYFGCEPKFATVSELEEHLAEIHTADKLKVWGISHSHITKWKVTIEDNVSENLDEDQESDNQLEQIQPQPPLSVIQSVSTAVDSTWTEPVTERLMVVPKERGLIPAAPGAQQNQPEQQQVQQQRQPTISAELEANHSFVLAVLRTLILTHQDDRHDEIRLNRWFITNEMETKYAYAHQKGLLIRCYNLKALFDESQQIMNILQSFDDTKKAIANERLKSIAPKDCFFMDEITTQPNDENLSDHTSWLGLALRVAGESFHQIAETNIITKVPYQLILKLVRQHLEVIHQEVGFFGGINMHSIYYDKDTGNVTLTDWGYNKPPFKDSPTDPMTGIDWPYNYMYKKCDASNYLVMDELAILCCFYKFIKAQAEFAGNLVMEFGVQKYKLKPLVAPLKELMQTLYKSKSLVGLRLKVSLALDLVLSNEVSATSIWQLIDTTFECKASLKQIKQIRLGKRSAQAATSTEELLTILEENEIKQSNDKKRQKQEKDVKVIAQQNLAQKGSSYTQ